MYETPGPPVVIYHGFFLFQTLGNTKPVCRFPISKIAMTKAKKVMKEKSLDTGRWYTFAMYVQS